MQPIRCTTATWSFGTFVTTANYIVWKHWHTHIYKYIYIYIYAYKVGWLSEVGKQIMIDLIWINGTVIMSTEFWHESNLFSLYTPPNSTPHSQHSAAEATCKSTWQTNTRNFQSCKSTKQTNTRSSQSTMVDTAGKRAVTFKLKYISYVTNWFH